MPRTLALRVTADICVLAEHLLPQLFSGDVIQLCPHKCWASVCAAVTRPVFGRATQRSVGITLM